MALTAVETVPANDDDGVDQVISRCMDPADPKSFFLYAGAGSGKTRSLVTALQTFSETHGDSFYKRGHKIAVITYTNAACDEITVRVARRSHNSENLFHISTIHSFCWLLIQHYHADIRQYLLDHIPEEIKEVEADEAKGRAGTKASFDRQRKIKSLQERLTWLSVPRQFIYAPDGNNFGKGSLSHAEVFKITGSFIYNKPVMQALIVKRFPFIFIDESQDTNKNLIDAFFHLENEKQRDFSLGLFGDQMQRIYLDGKEGMGASIPQRWEKPQKQLNHRCPRRVVQLSNAIRASVDQQVQKAREDSEQGLVRLFIAPSNTQDKMALEKQIKAQMKLVTKDELWENKLRAIGLKTVKSLTLEHHMAAERMGFRELFITLDRAPSLTTGLRNGTLPGLRFFAGVIKPVVAAFNADHHFELMALCREHSSLLKPDVIAGWQNESAAMQDPLKAIREAIEELVCCANGESATFADVLKTAARSNVFPIPDMLLPFVENSPGDLITAEEAGENQQTSLKAWREFLALPYQQINPYHDYISDIGEFDTHQGVKGREFERVFIVIADDEARGNSFSYEKIFGVKTASDNDKKKQNEGKDTSLERTLRLFYVTCTRAKKSLAIVAYSEKPQLLKNHVIAQGWFLESEVVAYEQTDN